MAPGPFPVRTRYGRGVLTDWRLGDGGAEDGTCEVRFDAFAGYGGMRRSEVVLLAPRMGQGSRGSTAHTVRQYTEAEQRRRYRAWNAKQAKKKKRNALPASPQRAAAARFVSGVLAAATGKPCDDDGLGEGWASATGAEEETEAEAAARAAALRAQTCDCHYVHAPGPDDGGYRFDAPVEWQPSVFKGEGASLTGPKLRAGAIQNAAHNGSKGNGAGCGDEGVVCDGWDAWLFDGLADVPLTGLKILDPIHDRAISHGEVAERRLAPFGASLRPGWRGRPGLSALVRVKHTCVYPGNRDHRRNSSRDVRPAQLLWWNPRLTRRFLRCHFVLRQYALLYAPHLLRALGAARRWYHGFTRARPTPVPRPVGGTSYAEALAKAEAAVKAARLAAEKAFDPAVDVFRRPRNLAWLKRGISHQAFVSEYEQRVGCLQSRLVQYEVTAEPGDGDGGGGSVVAKAKEKALAALPPGEQLKARVATALDGGGAPKRPDEALPAGVRSSRLLNMDRKEWDDLDAGGTISLGGGSGARASRLRSLLRPVDFTNDALEKYGDCLVGFTLTTMSLLGGVASEHHNLRQYLGISLTSDKNSSSNALLGRACRSSDFVNVYLSIPGDEDAAARSKSHAQVTEAFCGVLLASHLPDLSAGADAVRSFLTRMWSAADQSGSGFSEPWRRGLTVPRLRALEYDLVRALMEMADRQNNRARTTAPIKGAGPRDFDELIFGLTRECVDLRHGRGPNWGGGVPQFNANRLPEAAKARGPQQTARRMHDAMARLRRFVFRSGGSHRLDQVLRTIGFQLKKAMCVRFWWDADHGRHRSAKSLHELEILFSTKYVHNHVLGRHLKRADLAERGAREKLSNQDMKNWTNSYAAAARNRYCFLCHRPSTETQVCVRGGLGFC